MAALTVGFALPALAQPQHQVRLDYERQEGAAACPEIAAIRSGVAGRLGYEPFDDAAAEHVRATIRQSSQAGHVLEARIEMTDAEGNLKAERRLFSSQRDCVELASSVELALSIAIDPFHVSPRAAETDPASPSVATTTPPVAGARADDPSPAVSAPVASAATGKPALPLSTQVEVGMMTGLGAAPSQTLGFVAGAALRLGSGSLGVEGRADLPASTSLRVGEASTSLIVASLLPCVHYNTLAACALATAGALRAAGHGLVDSRQVTIPYLALGARLTAGIPITTDLGLALHADLTAPLNQAQLQVDGNDIWSAPAVSFALGLVLTMNIP
jgi:hypothetical protein